MPPNSANDTPNFYAAGSLAPTSGATPFSIFNGGTNDLLGRVQFTPTTGEGTQSYMLAWDVAATSEPLATLALTGFDAFGAGASNEQARFLFQASNDNWYASDPFTDAPMIEDATAANWYAYTPHSGGVATFGALSGGLNFSNIQRVGYYQQFDKITGSGNGGGVFATAFQATVGSPQPPNPLVLEFNASQDAVDGDNQWLPNIDNGNMTGGMPTEFFTFSSNATSNAVNDPSVPGITASYGVGGYGRNGWNGTGNADAPSPSAAGGLYGDVPSSFEVWFKPDSLSGGDQIIAEFGGGIRGSYISLQNDTLSFHTNEQVGEGNNGFVTLNTTLSSTSWTQVLATWDGGAGEYELFINGQSVDFSSGTLLDAWGGANAWGLGQTGDSDDPTDSELGIGDDIALNGPLPVPTVEDAFPLAGQIGIFRYYNSVLSDQEVLDSYNAIAAPPSGTPGDFNDDGVVNLADYTVWRDNLGASESVLPAGSGDGSSTVDAGDYATWKNAFGAGSTASQASAAAVPEPTALGLLSLVIAGGLLCRRLRS